MSFVNLLSLMLNRSELIVTTAAITEPRLPLSRKADDVNIEAQFTSYGVYQRRLATITGDADQKHYSVTSVGNGHVPSRDTMQEITATERNTCSDW